MPIRNAKAVTFRPTSLTDTIDGTSAAPGGMSILTNLVPSPSSPNMFVPRPAEISVFAFPGFNAPLVPTALFITGNFAYGMVPSSRFPGKDEPFCVNLSSMLNVPVSGVTSANCPTSPGATGDWVPPSIAAFPSRIIVAHPGFSGGANPFFGWFDISGFSSSSLKGNTTTGSPIIASIQTPGGTSSPIISGVQPGMTISGAGIPLNATVISVSNGTFSVTTTGNYTSGSPTVTNIPSTTGFQVGMNLSGVGPATGAVIASVDSATQITMSLNAISTGTGTALIVTGGGSITISANATATANNVALTIAGGTQAAPLWAAGNTNTNPLTAPPACVAQFNGRCWYGVSNFAIFSDSLNPTQVSFASQALTIDDGTPITALSGLPLTSQVAGGSIQSLIVFKGAGPIFQITGDSATNNLAVNAVAGSVGTLAPNTIAATPLGTAYMAPDGLRILGLSGTLSDPIGVDGRGVFVPFANALFPSRMAAAFGQNTYRITVQNNASVSQAFQEYWYDFNTKGWSGPHTFPHAIIRSYPSQSSFIGAGTGINGQLWQSSVFPINASTYTENGTPLTFQFKTSLLPDNNEMAMNQVTESTIALAMSATDTFRVVVYNETGDSLDTVYIKGAGPTQTLWGQFKWGRDNWTAANGGQGGSGLPWDAAIWGAFFWGALGNVFGQYAIPWDAPIVFKQAFFEVTGASGPNQAIGNVYLRYQICGYQLLGLGVGE